MIIRTVFFLFLTIILTACTTNTPAPVVTVQPQASVSSGHYRVHRGDTLYSIAWMYNLDYRRLARANHLSPPYRIYPAQNLRIKLVPPRREKSQKRVRKKRISKVVHWQWPARGRVISGFSAALAGNKGIDIAARYGSPVYASANGIVVYSGAGVRGYGKLIIVKHNNSYLSAYAFNKRILVREGSRVRAGQVIAEVGRNDAGRTMLHFEIRRNGKPVDPLHYLS